MENYFPLSDGQLLWCMTAIDSDASDAIRSYLEPLRIEWFQIAGSDPGGNWPPSKSVVLLASDTFLSNSIRLLKNVAFKGPVVLWRRDIGSGLTLLSKEDLERLDYLRYVDVLNPSVEELLKILDVVFSNSDQWEDFYHATSRGNVDFLNHFAPGTEVITRISD